MVNLQSLKFSPLRCRHESIALYENEKEQRFLIQVRGLDKEAVERYIKELQLYLEVLPYKPLQSEEQLGEQGKRTEQSIQDLEITIEAIQARDIKPPYILRFAIDPSIQNGVNQDYQFSDTTEARVTITAYGGTLAARLRQGNQIVNNATVDVYSGLPDPQATLSPITQSNKSTSFSFIVTGMEDNSRYALNGDVVKSAYATYSMS